PSSTLDDGAEIDGGRPVVAPLDQAGPAPPEESHVDARAHPPTGLDDPVAGAPVGAGDQPGELLARHAPQLLEVALPLLLAVQPHPRRPGGDADREHARGKPQGHRPPGPVHRHPAAPEQRERDPDQERRRRHRQRGPQGAAQREPVQGAVQAPHVALDREGRGTPGPDHAEKLLRLLTLWGWLFEGERAAVPQDAAVIKASRSIAAGVGPRWTSTSPSPEASSSATAEVSVVSATSPGPSPRRRA